MNNEVSQIERFVTAVSEIYPSWDREAIMKEYNSIGDTLLISLLEEGYCLPLLKNARERKDETTIFSIESEMHRFLKLSNLERLKAAKLILSNDLVRFSYKIDSDLRPSEFCKLVKSKEMLEKLLLRSEWSRWDFIPSCYLLGDAKAAMDICHGYLKKYWMDHEYFPSLRLIIETCGDVIQTEEDLFHIVGFGKRINFNLERFREFIKLNQNLMIVSKFMEEWG